MVNLKKGQVLYVDNIKYIVVNMVEYKEDTWLWQEYEIRSDNYTYKWLTVEENENKQVEYYIYSSYYSTNMNIDINEIEQTIENIKYELYEKGRAVVNNFFGDADVDKYESCEYFDYISEDKKTILSVEKWEDEIEKSIGSKIEKERVQITEEIVKNSKQTNEFGSYNQKQTKLNPLWIISILIIFLPIIIRIFYNSNNSIEKYLQKETSKYTYVTSVTNNVNNKKAKVYKSSFSTIDETVKDIIDGIPDKITDTIDSNPNTENDGIGLHTKREFAYIYKEKSEIYIQVSSKEYVNNSGTMYHSRYHSYYYNTFLSTRRSSTYSNYAYSARQKSINSRTSSGGGTSSGK